MKKNKIPKPKQLVRFDWAINRLLRSKVNFGVLEGFLSELLKCKLKIEDMDMPIDVIQKATGLSADAINKA